MVLGEVLVKHVGQLLEEPEPLPAGLPRPLVEITEHRALIGVVSQPHPAVPEQVRLQ